MTNIVVCAKRICHTRRGSPNPRSGTTAAMPPATNAKRKLRLSKTGFRAHHRSAGLPRTSAVSTSHILSNIFHLLQSVGDSQSGRILSYWKLIDDRLRKFYNNRRSGGALSPNVLTNGGNQMRKSFVRLLFGIMLVMNVLWVPANATAADPSCLYFAHPINTYDTALEKKLLA